MPKHHLFLIVLLTVYCVAQAEKSIYAKIEKKLSSQSQNLSLGEKKLYLAMLLKTSQYKKGISLCKKTLSEHESIDLRVAYFKFLYYSGHHETAVNALWNMRTLYPENPYPLYLAGFMFSRQGENTANIFRLVIKLDPTFTEALVELALISNNKSEAFESYARALLLVSSESHLWKDQLQQFAEKWTLAQQKEKKSWEKIAQNLERHLQNLTSGEKKLYLAILIKTGQYKKGIDLCEQMLSKNQSIDIIAAYFRLLCQSGDHKSAVEFLSDIDVVYLETPHIMHLFIDMWMRRCEDGSKSLRRLIKQNPVFTQGLVSLAMISSSREQAFEYYGRALLLTPLKSYLWQNSLRKFANRWNLISKTN